MKLIIPIEIPKLKFDKQEIQLGNDYVLKKTASVLKVLKKNNNVEFQIGTPVIEAEIDPKEKEKNPDGYWRIPLDKVLTFLRLFKQGTVCIRFVFNLDGEYIKGMNYYTPWEIDKLDKEMEITSDEIPSKLSDHFKDCHGLDPRYNFSIWEFKDFYFHPRAVWRFMSMITSLERLLKSPEEYGSKEGLGERLGKFIGDGKIEDLKLSFIKSYEMRNILFHRTEEVNKIDFSPPSFQLENYLRKLIMFLQKEKSLIFFFPDRCEYENVDNFYARLKENGLNMFKNIRSSKKKRI